MSPTWMSVAFSGATVIFNAGFWFAVLRQVRRDLNGVGKKQRDAEADASRERLRTAVFLMMICPDGDREEIGGMLMNGAKK